MNQLYILFIILILLVFIIISLLIIWGFLYKPKFQQTYVQPGVSGNSPICLRTPTPCKTNLDCRVCADNEELECVEVSRFTQDQKDKYGDTQKLCLKPLPTDKKCNHKLGGIWSWTGYSFIDNMEWDCLCTYPEIAGGKGCSELNANICAGNSSNYNYDATTMDRGPKPEDCTCPQGTVLMNPNNSPIPLCVPNKPYLCTDKQMCESMYNNTTYIG